MNFGIGFLCIYVIVTFALFAQYMVRHQDKTIWDVVKSWFK